MPRFPSQCPSLSLVCLLLCQLRRRLGLLLVQNLELELSKDLLLEVEVLQLALEAVSVAVPEAAV